MERASDEQDSKDKKKHGEDQKLPRPRPGIMVERDVPIDQMTALQRALAESPEDGNE